MTSSDVTLAGPATRSPDPAVGTTGGVVRTDIQALRAVAVLAVVAFHLFPHRLSGGFVGVDAFFVISGFLITSHLLAHPPSRVTDLLQFWSRRIRRLLPASLLVLFVCLVATRLIGPETLWANTAQQVRSAALYVLNWRLADDAVDYLAATNSATPVQNYWSLSVEEQFYLFWPVLIFVLALIARRHRKVLIIAGLAAVTVASFWYSVTETAADPARAYFVTPTRIWELGVGACLAAWLAPRAFGRTTGLTALPVPPAARAALAWVGLATLAWVCLTYSAATPFPSWRAAVPVLATALVIAANAPRRVGSPARLMAVRPVQWIGNVSYSVYLWHWPLIVLVPYVSGGDAGRLDRLAVLVASFVLGGLTKRYVEDRFRTPKWGRPLVKPYVLAAAAMAVVVGAASLLTAEVNGRVSDSQRALQAKLDGGDPCFGAVAISAGDDRCPPVTSGPLTISPATVAAAKSDAFNSVNGKDCLAHQSDFVASTCTYGTGPTRVALVGNSHAAQYYPTLRALADDGKFTITTYLAAGCAVADVLQVSKSLSQSQACLRWQRGVIARVARSHYDLVVMSNHIAADAVGHDRTASLPVYAAGYQRVLKRFVAAGSRVLVVRDSPTPNTLIPDCLAENSDDYSACDGTRKKWIIPDPTETSVRQLANPTVTLADLNDHICQRKVCRAVVGGVPVYFDSSHLSGAFARSLAPFLEPRVLAALDR